MTDYSMARTFTRVPVHITTEILTADGRAARGPTHDVSISGLSVETEMALELGTPCDLRILLATGAAPIEIEARGSVSRNEGGVLAFHLSTVDADAFEHLRKLVLYNSRNARGVEQELEEHADETPTLAPLTELS
jgi:PilZ domain